MPRGQLYPTFWRKFGWVFCGRVLCKKDIGISSRGTPLFIVCFFWCRLLFGLCVTVYLRLWHTTILKYCHLCSIMSKQFLQLFMLHWLSMLLLRVTQCGNQLMKWNWFLNPRSQKANETESTSRWSQTGYFSRMAECSSLREIGTNANLMIQLEERLEYP